MTNHIRFDDAVAYERYMGKWSQLVGEAFLDWLAPPSGLRWLDVGCGNGAFTERIVERCAPLSVDGIDPSEEQLAYARSRPALHDAQFRPGDAMAPPFDDDAFDAAVMPLVIFFVPDPARGVAEMARVVRAGGIVTAYAWDMPGNGFSVRGVAGRDARTGRNRATAAESRRVQYRRHARVVAWCRCRGHRDPADHRGTDVRRSRRLLGDGAGWTEPPVPAGRHDAPRISPPSRSGCESAWARILPAVSPVLPAPMP